MTTVMMQNKFQKRVLAHIGPKTEAAELIHSMKHRQANEDFRDAMNRIAFGLKDDDRHYHQFRDILLHQRFIPGGRIQAAIGSERDVSAYNCMVSGTIEDSYVHGRGCIMERVWEAAATMRMGCGIGYDFSTLRPKGALIRKQQTPSSGPLGFLPIFNSTCLATASAGHRRGAQMGVLRVDHPDIEAFINAKHSKDALRGFNLSIAITDEFMLAVQGQKKFWLRWGDEKKQEVDALTLWEKIMRSTYKWAEPGVLYIDTINRMNNLYYCEVISATNPCGEQPLPPYGACLLGSINLPRHLYKRGDSYYLDTDSIIEDMPAVMRAMDNVVDRTSYPLPEQRAEALNKRRMGIGVMGLATALEACGHAYGSLEFLVEEDKLLRAITRACYLSSIQLAREKGTFPMYHAEKYWRGKFVTTLDEDVQEMGARYGMRNSHTTSIAPTGTIQKEADCPSGGMEPVFAYDWSQPVNTPDGFTMVSFKDMGAHMLGVRGKLARDVKAKEHVAVLCTAQKNVDSAVSKTCNVDEGMLWDDFKGIYFDAYEGGAKGCTTFNEHGSRDGLMVASEEGTRGGICEIGPGGTKDCG